MQGVEIDLCPGCRGVWLDRDELSRLVGTGKDIELAGVDMKVTHYTCPRCHQTLTEVPYTWETRILVDVCAACEGIWLDHGELEKISKALSAIDARFPQARLQRLQRRNARREALSELYHVGDPAAKAPLASRTAFLFKVYGLFVGSLAVTVVGAIFGNATRTYEHPWIWFFVSLGALLFAMCVRKVPVVNLVVLAGYTLTEGFFLSGIIPRYFGAGKGTLVVQALVITTGVFMGLSGYIWYTRKDLSGWGPWLFGLLMSLVLSMVVMLFFSTPLSWMIWTWASAVIFCGYILYDTSRILLKDETDEYVSACLDLYLDFINLFLDILRILSKLES